MTILGYDHIPRPVRARLLRDVCALRVARGLPAEADRELLGVALAAADAGVREAVVSALEAFMIDQVLAFFAHLDERGAPTSG
jgi:hypothetical protein